MANPFVGTWDTLFDSIVSGNPPGNATLTVTESFRFDSSGNTLDGMHEGLKDKQPSTLHGPFDKSTSAWSGRWMNTPTSAEQGDFTLTLGTNKDTFTGTWGQGSDAQTMAWNGRLRRHHRGIEAKKLSEIPPLH